MRRLSTIVCIFYFLAVTINAQVKPAELSAAEELEAKNLAVSFFNRFQETQDLAPLIKEFFVRDFARRLKFCHATGECGGSGRDFWQEYEEFVAVNATEADYQRFYVSVTNYFFLYYRSIQYLNDNYPQEMTDGNRETAGKSIEKELKSLLEDDPKLIKFNFDGDSGDSDESFKFNTLNELRRYLNDFEKFIAALRIVETKLRNDFLKKNTDANKFYSPADFGVSVGENYNRFFDYPVGTRMLGSGCRCDSLIIGMNLIKEDGKLKIVAVYPPID